MNLFSKTVNWEAELHPIFKKYSYKKHPLEYKNLYQLLIMVILSAQDSDNNINQIAPIFFQKFPNIESLSKSDFKEISPYLTRVKHFKNKAESILSIARSIKKDGNIPLKMKELTNLKGIGRKSANVIMREFNIETEGIMVDLHVLRVAPRIGIISTTRNGLKAEKELIAVLPNKIWKDVGMVISFLGREICRPIPKCQECPIYKTCQYPDKTN